MSCPTCDHTLHEMGCRTTGMPFFWCPRCGTMKTCDGVIVKPSIVDSCREFESTIVGVCAEHSYQWKAFGIAESINLPKNRGPM